MAHSTDSFLAGEDQPNGSIHDEEEALPPPEVEYYDMSKEKKMIIFNHYRYIKDYPELRESPPIRHGTSRDVEALERAFRALNFDVETYNDETHDNILSILQELCKQNHHATSCVCVCVMTHGWHGGLLCAYDKMYNLSELVNLLQNCAPGLVGKPKWLVVQACRGGEVDAGQLVDGRIRHAERLPSHVDTLVLTSSVEDFRSFRDRSSGSWLIQELCRVLRARRGLDALHVATLVTSLVAREHGHVSSPDLPILHNKLQTPEVRSTLTKLLRLSE